MSNTVTQNERLGKGDKASKHSDCFEITRNIVRPVSSFGVMNSDGNPIEMFFVRSSLAKKGDDNLGAKPCKWYEYQLKSMFASW